MTLTQIDAALATMDDSRRTHLEWLAYFEANPHEAARHSETVHGADDQQAILDEYFNVQLCLRELRNLKRQTPEPRK